jgi:hypothetical protein
MSSQSFDSTPHDFKPNYDDDLAFSSYNSIARHQTYTVEPPQSHPPEHRRGPSYPLQKPHFSSKNSDDTSHALTPVAYPPPPPEKEIDGLGFWQKVCRRLSPTSRLLKPAQILPESMACRLYVLTVLIQTTVDLAIEGELLLQINKNADAKPSENAGTHKMPVYLSIFALAQCVNLSYADIDFDPGPNTVCSSLSWPWMPSMHGIHYSLFASRTSVNNSS